jgi:lambda family phage portal protein
MGNPLDLLKQAGKAGLGRAVQALERVAGPLAAVPKVALDQLSPWKFSWNDGSKFPGDFGPTEFLVPDYWTLRARSAQLFETNLYARGVIRRLVTSVIANGLYLESVPEEKILGYPEDGLLDWSDDVENRFDLWANNAVICDQKEQSTFGELHQTALTEALVVGDILCVLRQDQRTRLPRVQLINGASVRTPFGVTPREGHKIVHGVELDGNGRHVAYWITQDDGTSKRLPAFGEKSGRRIAWLFYGCDKRMDEVRGKPLLSLMLQSLKEIDRYRDSTQRKATILSMLAAFVSKDQPGPGSRPLTAAGGAVRRGTELATTDTKASAQRTYSAAMHIPGLVVDELNAGEKIQAFTTSGTTEQFGEFEHAIIATVAWAHEIPPEVLLQSYDSNYSASAAALNDWKAYLSKARTTFGKNFCQPVYVEWLFGEVVARRISARGLLEAWNDYSQWDIFGAWTRADWSGNVKPSVDPVKVVKAADGAIALGLTTRDRASREYNGSKFSKNIKRLKRENEAVRDANMPLAELKAAEKAAGAAQSEPPTPPDSEGGDEKEDEDS